MYEYKALSASMQQVSAHFWTPSTFCALRGDPNRGWVAGDGFSYPKKASSERSSSEGGRGSHGSHHQGGLEQFLSRLCAPEDLAFSLGMFLSPACLCQPFSQLCLLSSVILRSTSGVKVLGIKCSSTGH